MNKPSLAFYTNMPTPYQLDLLKYLKDYFRLTVVYFTKRENDRVWDLEDKGDGYEVIFLENSLFAKSIQKVVTSFHHSNKLRSVVRKLNADFAIINGTYWSPNVRIAVNESSRNKAMVAFWGEPVFASRSKIAHKLKQSFLNWLFHRVDMILAIGKKAIDSYTSFGFGKKIVNLPYNIDHRPFLDVDPKIFDSMRKEYSPSGELILLSSGALIERKGMDIVIEAFRNSSVYPDARLLIIGDGPEMSKLKELAGVDPRISFLGFQQKSAVPYYFLLADIFVFASRYDGWGLVINEAMLADAAIICSDQVGAAADLIETEENGLICRSGNVNEFSTAIDRLGGDVQLRNRFTSTAKLKGEQISSQQIARQIYGLYELGK